MKASPINTKPVIPVAAIGMACRLPGGIDSPAKLWEALARGEDLVTEVPRERWDIDEFYDSEPGVPGRSTSKWGAFLEDVGGFDPDFFHLNEREAAALDPQHRLLLETSWETVEHAGLVPEVVFGSRTGVFIGLTHFDYQLVTVGSQAMEKPYGFTGNIFSMASGRIAYVLGLRGPALTVDTACSSSLTAVHLAFHSLNDGESDMALAGGAYVMLDPRKFVAGTAEGHLSPTGRCRAFDVAADGYVCGEAAAVVLLKRLPDALRDGDQILAVLRATAANQDGHTVNISTPSVDAQTAVFRAALAAAGVDAGSVGMVEAHGPGTPVGDPIEFTSLAKVYGVEGPCALGSVKTNFGHAQSAAGVLGLMKTILALQHGGVPQNLHFTRLPDELARIDTRLFVPQAHTPWPANGRTPRRAAVSSYGLSGTNVHAIVESAPETTAPVTGSTPANSTAPQIFALSSTSSEELRRTAGRLADWVRTQSDVALPDLAYTLARRRAHRPVRTAVIASSPPELAEALRQVAESEVPYQAAVGRDDRGPVWVFSGQGSQWAGMGAYLLANEPVFAATVAQAEPLIARESGFSVTDAMSAPRVVTGIERIQPTLFTIQVALAATMRSCGVRPGAVIGHSLGEVAAAVVAGALSLGDGVRIICRRSRLMSRISGAGAMASVELPAKQVLTELAVAEVEDAVVAVVASPESTVIGGATQTVRELVAAWEQRDVMAREIAVDVASHSPQVEPILDELAEVLADLHPMAPEIPYYSATQFDSREQSVFDSDYWVDNLRQTVRFSGAVQAALEDGYRVFAELAPHPLLTHAVEQTARSLDVLLAALAAMRREQPSAHGLRGFLADLHSSGAEVDFSALYPSGRLIDAPLPTWTHRRLWLTPDAQDARTHNGCAVSVHPLLGQHVHLQEEPERHIWQGDVGTGAQPWLGDHRIRDVAVLPGAAYCEMALAAARTVLGEAGEVRDVRFEQALLLNEQSTLEASATVASAEKADFAAVSHHEGERLQHAAAVLHAAAPEQPPAYDLAALLSAHPCRRDGAEIRESLEHKGIEYGPAFTGLIAAYTGAADSKTLLAEVMLPREIRSQTDAYGVHPALLDACFQSVGAHPAVRALSDGALALPLAVSRLRVHGAARSAHYCYTRVTKAESSGVVADLDVLDEGGTVLLAVQGLRLGTGTSEVSHRERVLSERLLAIEWRRRQLPELGHADAGSWLVISASSPDSRATALAAALKDRGAQCTAMGWTVQDDPTASAEEFKSNMQESAFTGVVVLAGPANAVAGKGPAELGCDHVRHLVHIARELAEFPAESPRLWVVTCNARTVVAGDVANLEQAGLRGLTRVIGAEHPHLHATQIDLDSATDTEQLAQQLVSGSDEDETAWRANQWYVARLSPAPLAPEDRRTVVVHHERDGIRARIRTPGDLKTLEIAADKRNTPGPEQIEVAVSASSINFADVLIAFGRYPEFEGKLPQLGTDFAGVVTAVGPGVVDHRVGDRVGGLSADGCWGTFLTCDARTAVALPTGLTEGQAAAVTTATATAWHGLHDLAGIKSGEKVLIHSGTGGVGQAAIAIASTAGAEIFATAGSEQRRRVLRDMGITHVYDSRSTEFAEQIRRDTHGYGVDIVLNSVSGAAQRAGIELLAFGGRFVEIGKRDIYGDSRLGLFPFRRNLAFYGVDLGLLSRSHPERLRDLLSTVYRLTGDGTLPMPQSTHYHLADAATAIRLMSSAAHTGKLVLDMPRTGSSRVVVRPAQVQVFRSDGAYIISGGLGGLGLFLAEKMAAAGCGRIVLSSRSEPDRDTLHTIEHIRASGADVVVECGDISEAATAHRLVAAARATGLALRGVLHAAAVIEDATLTNITDELVERDWAPKVAGAWHLHTATADEPLDWFCSFSSAAALVGSPGQGAYAAANSWLDAFTLWRRTQGLPATAIAWGAWAQIGRGAALAEDARLAIAPDEGAFAFEALLRHDRAYSGYAPYVDAPWLDTLARSSPFAEAFRVTSQNQTATSRLRAELNELPTDEWPARLRRVLSDQISLILRRSVDPDHPLSEYGLDSLGSLELRTRIEAETDVRISPREFVTTNTIRELADLLCERIAATPAVTSDGHERDAHHLPSPGRPRTQTGSDKGSSSQGTRPSLPPFSPQASKETDGRSADGDMPDSRLALLDHAFYSGHRAVGQQQLIQVTWVYEHPVDFDALRGFHRNLGHGLLGRLIECSPLPFARHRWVAAQEAPDIDIAESARPRAELSDWTDERLQVPIDAERGPGWHLGVLKLNDGSTAVTLVVSHFLIDGLGLAIALADAVSGRKLDLNLPQPNSRTQLRAVTQDARQAARDTPEVARAFFTGLSLNRRQRRELRLARRQGRDLPRSPAPRAVILSEGDGDEVVLVPGITVYVDADDWDARAEALGATGDTLIAGMAAKLGERMERRRADGAVTLELPMSDRVEGDTRAIALSVTRVSVDPTRVTTDLRDIHTTVKQALTASLESPEEPKELLWLAPLRTTRSLRRGADAALADPDLPVFCSNLGDFSTLICRIDGTDAEYVTTRGASTATREWLDRAGGVLRLQAGRIGDKIGISVVAYQPGAANTKAALRELTARTLAEFDLTGEID
ncbi:sulfolipid-1 biosynthesis phthioceranic/hydroxyphthioceranic acid synthase [Mycobacterium sp. 852014-52144_SCH5372336]|uniref:sulfolipid-1 biosynthesis phthioceranic/hydroxyphthioceranic acid synthase n=1 Tax=Mycobacterium sp. 852014-52144_SCH5372336 TaxID=1834115 RepID=UPI000A80CD2B